MNYHHIIWKYPVFFSELNSKIQEYVLWENENPNQEFVYGTYTLSDNISNYESYEIIYQDTSTSSKLNRTGKIPINYGTTLQVSTFKNRYRTCNVPNNNSIVFNNGYIVNNYPDNEQLDTVCIPLKIIGYK